MKNLVQAFKIEAARLDESFAFQSGRFGFNLLSDIEFENALERSFEKYDWDAPIASVRDFAHRLLCMTLHEISILEKSKDQVEILHALCSGIGLIGILQSTSEEDCKQSVCPTCIGKSYASNAARQAANARYQDDPKQKAKSSIKEHWKQWQADPAQYVSQAEFARDMLEAYPILVSHKKVTEWCTEWKKQ